MMLMRRPSRALRTVYLCLAALQFSLPAAASLADARLDATGNLPIHIEHVHSGCAHVHPANCVFCQFIALRFAGGAPASLALDVGRQVLPTQRDPGQPHASSTTRAPNQRAPPTLL
jgi:hypothetical protein